MNYINWFGGRKAENKDSEPCRMACFDISGVDSSTKDGVQGLTGKQVELCFWPSETCFKEKLCNNVNWIKNGLGTCPVAGSCGQNRHEYLDCIRVGEFLL